MSCVIPALLGVLQGPQDSRLLFITLLSFSPGHNCYIFATYNIVRGKPQSEEGIYKLNMVIEEEYTSNPCSYEESENEW